MPKAVAASGGVAHKIICYTCGEEGHKSPQCPKGVKSEKAWPKEIEAKSVKRIWRSQPKGVQLEGVVNGHVTMVLLDSGAAISVVPESLVSGDQMTGNTVAVMPFGAKEPMVLPEAEVSFEVDKLKWVESVAVVSEQQGARHEVLVSLDLQSKRGLELVLVANKVSPREFLRVMSRSRFAEDKERDEEEAMLAEQEVPRAKACPEEVNSEIEVESELMKDCAGVGDLDRKEEESEGGVLCIKEDEFEGGVLCNKEEELEGGVLCIEEEFEKECLGIEEDALAEDEEEGDRQRSELREEVEVEIPPIKAGSHCRVARVALVKETRADPSLEERKVPRMERVVMYEPFEVRAVDIVGPRPKGKGWAQIESENQDIEDRLVEIWKLVRRERGESASSKKKRRLDWRKEKWFLAE